MHTQIEPETEKNRFISGLTAEIVIFAYSRMHRFFTECHFYTSNTRIGLKSVFLVFGIYNRFPRY